MPLYKLSRFEFYLVFNRKYGGNRCVTLLHVIHLWLGLLFLVYVNVIDWLHHHLNIPMMLCREMLFWGLSALERHITSFWSKQDTTLSTNRIYFVDGPLLHMVTEGGSDLEIPSVLFLPQVVFDVWRSQKFPLCFWGHWALLQIWMEGVR